MPADLPLLDQDLLERSRLQTELLKEQRRIIDELEQQQVQLRRLTATLQAELENYRSMKDEWDWFFEHAPDIMVIHDTDGRLRRVNPAVKDVLGYTPEEFLSIDRPDLLHPDDLQRSVEQIARVASGLSSVDFVARSRHKNGEWRWLAWTAPAPRIDDGGLHYMYAVARDITSSKLAEQDLLRRAGHDALTGLPNRASFDQALERALAQAALTGGSTGLLLIDLDGFKEVNDTYGHLAGDVVLKTVASRLLATQRDGDMMARLGGDEFACVIENAGADALEMIANRMLAAVQTAIDLGEHTVTVSCSIGIAMHPEDGKDSRILFDKADNAMYGVKARGKSGIGRGSR